MTNSDTNDKHQPASKPSFAALVLSTLAAAFGVQSNKNRERDFQHSSIVPFVVAGVLFTALFVLTLVLIVSWVLG